MLPCIFVILLDTAAKLDVQSIQNRKRLYVYSYTHARARPFFLPDGERKKRGGCSFQARYWITAGYSLPLKFSFCGSNYNNLAESPGHDGHVGLERLEVVVQTDQGIQNHLVLIMTFTRH